MDPMKVSRSKFLLLALVCALVAAAAPSTASAVPTSLPKPTVTGLPAATNQATATFTISTTAPIGQFVDFGCSYDSPFLQPCAIDFPTCTAGAGGQTCSQVVARALSPGKHIFRFLAAYCDAPTLDDCVNNDEFYASEILTIPVEVDLIRPTVQIVTGPGKNKAVVKPGSGAFTFTSNEVATFTCTIDDRAPAPCASPFAVPKWLKNGKHTFDVTATDAAGNVGFDSQSFVVDVFRAKKCAKGKSKSAKAKRKKCVKKNTKDKKAWKKKHGLK
jgi:hypothetical protein